MVFAGLSRNYFCLRSVVVAVAIILSAVAMAQAQDLSGFSGVGNLVADGVTVTPEIQFGYQRLGLSFNLPAIRQSILFPRDSTLDLAVRNGNLWCGALDVVADLPSGLSVGVKGQVNARNNANAYESQEYVEGSEQGVHWRAEKLQWWTLDGRLMYKVKPGLAAGIGLRYEQLSFNLQDPVNDEGEPLTLDDSGYIVPGFPFLGTYTRHWLYTSTVASKEWIPYVGLNFVGNGFKASLLASPFASVNVTIPASYFTDLTLFVISPIGLLTGEHWEYRVTKPAVFVEANLAHDFAVSQGVKISVWGSASWLSLRGKGAWTYQISAQSPPDPPSTDPPQNETNTATFTRYLWGGGLSADVSF